jgi:hypothetical protein
MIARWSRVERHASSRQDTRALRFVITQVIIQLGGYIICEVGYGDRVYLWEDAGIHGGIFFVETTMGTSCDVYHVGRPRRLCKATDQSSYAVEESMGWEGVCWIAADEPHLKM